MSTELRDLLQASLGDGYRVDAELTGGGMSRVFRAHDATLDRAVVVKVLHPDLFGGIAVDRFRREIQVAAQLQHPHVVPILAAGEVDGLPYLIMPFVTGRSLRERIGEAERLPLDEVVPVLRDVARALDYAHSRGVIHRDIKPDNVLLSHGAATVTDFGVAKAVSAARRDTATLTSVGMSVGTPTYMAPEQAAGDPSVDARADIYAWGVLAYELLAGAPPFNHQLPQRQIAAHLTETPVPIATHRPDCPPALAALVMRCLEKLPDDRPQQASALVRGLDAVGSRDGVVTPTPADVRSTTRHQLARALALYALGFLTVTALAQAAILLIGLPGWVLPGTVVVLAAGLPIILFTAFANHRAGLADATHATAGGKRSDGLVTRIAVQASPHFTWRRTAMGGVIAVSGFALLVIGFMTMRALGIGPASSLYASGVMSEQDRVLVADFTVPGGDSALGPVLSEGVRTSLEQSRTVGVVTSIQSASALRRMELDPSVRLTLPLARQLAEREGIKAVLDGTVTPVAGSYIITLKLYATADTSNLVTLQESAEDATDLIPAIDRATRRLRERMGDSFRKVRETPRLERVTTASLPALRKYTEGWRANTFESNWPKAIAALEEAVSLDTTFALAYRQAALVYWNAGLRPGRTDTLLQLGFRHRDRLPPLERALVEGSYYAYSSARDGRLARAAFERAVAADSTNASALNSLGLSHISSRQSQRAIPVFEQMVRTNPDNAFALSNLTTALHESGHEDSARKVLALGIQRFPANANMLAWRRIFWTSDRQRDSARAICTELTRHERITIRSTGMRCLIVVTMMEGRLREAYRFISREASMSDSIGREGSVMLGMLDSLGAEAYLLGRGPAVARTLDRTLGRTPLDTGPVGLGLRLAVARIYAAAGAPAKGRAMLEDYDRLVPDSTARRTTHLQRHLALGDVALAEGRHAEAIRLFQRADTLDDGMPQPCDVCVLPRLAEAYELAGQGSAAIAAYEQYLASRHAWRRTEGDGLFYAVALKRLGDLHEGAGNREAAIGYMQRFIDLWSAADPELQPMVATVRRRLLQLERGRG